MTTTPPARPDLSQRPHSLSVEREMSASPAALFQAWTTKFDAWFATPGTLLMRGALDSPFFFEVHAQGNRYPHYGRFLRLEPDRLVELTWVTGAGGTEGAETVMTVELEPRDSGALLRLRHAGFATDEAARGHEQAWPSILAHLDEQLTAA
jgi:uncharacterized protein YndB with AHSA1/START domain